MARKTRLTREVIDAIVHRIGNGSFPYVAAQSVGIPKSTFYAWMQKGENGRGVYRELWDKVRTAAAEARTDAEARVFEDNPFAWLRYGPGRERPDEPGWTESPKTVQVESNVQVTGPMYAEVDEKTMADAMVEMEKLGFLQLTEQGRSVFNCDKDMAVATKVNAVGVGQIIDGQVVNANGKRQDDR